MADRNVVSVLNVCQRKRAPAPLYAYIYLTSEGRPSLYLTAPDSVQFYHVISTS